MKRLYADILVWVFLVLPARLLGQGDNGVLEGVQVRLSQGASENAEEVRDGRVEVLYDGEWGTVCDDGWRNIEAGVICRMLGYEGVALAYNGSHFPPAKDNVPLLLDDVRCDGNEATIAVCQHAAWGVSNCGHSEDAGVICLGTLVKTTPKPTPRTTTTTAPPRICDTPSEDIRLVDGANDWVGRVQIRERGRWWEVCDDSWGQQNAQVVCRMLCYNPDNARAHLGAAFGNMTEDILLDDVQCGGTEGSLLECTAAQQEVHNCDYTEGAGVSCMPDGDGPPPVPDPDIECDSATETIAAIFLRADDDRLRPEHLTVEGVSADCGYTTRMDDFYVYIYIPFIGCNTQRDINETHIIYNNMVVHEVPPENDIITRRQIFKIPVYCLMGRNDDPSNGVAPVEQTAPPQYGEGQFIVDMFIFTDSRFKEIIDVYPARVVLREDVYVGLTLTTTDRQLKIVVPRCYATPEEDPESEPQHLLIVDKCAVDRSITYYPINQTMFAFRFESFKFLTNSDVIYIHCKAYVCGTEEKDRRCDRTCSYGASSGRRKKRDVHEGLDFDDIFFGNRTIFSKERGPIVVYDTAELQPVKPTIIHKITETTTTMTSRNNLNVSRTTLNAGKTSTTVSEKRTTTESLVGIPDPQMVDPKQVKDAAASSTNHIRITIGTLLAMCFTVFLHL